MKRMGTWILNFQTVSNIVKRGSPSTCWQTILFTWFQWLSQPSTTFL